LTRGGGGPGGSKRTTTGSKRAARGRRMTNFDRLDAASSDRDGGEDKLQDEEADGCNRWIRKRETNSNPKNWLYIPC
jgi:hypothetical protein